MLTDRVDIWEARLADGAANRALEAVLREDERLRARRFAFAVHRNQFVWAHAFVRGVLARYTRRPPEALAFGRTPYGKPFLLDNDLDLRFNVSHSGDCVVCGVTRGEEVGVDVERLRAIEDADAIAARFFSAAEQTALAASPTNDRARAFLACWTRKEAYVKGRGLGLSCALDAFDVALAPDCDNALLACRLGAGDCWWIAGVDVARGFVCAVAVRGALGSRIQGRNVSVEVASASISARVHSIRKYSPRTSGAARFE